MSHLLTPDMRKWHEELERFRADLAALRRRAEQAERERDALQRKVDEAQELVRGVAARAMKRELYPHTEWGAINAVAKWDAERTAAAPHGDAANEAEQEAQTHYP